MNKKINSNFEKTELLGIICGVDHSPLYFIQMA